MDCVDSFYGQNVHTGKQQATKSLMKKPYFIILAGLLCLPSLAATARPNMLYILADDLGYADLSAQGRSELEFSTPEIDSIFTGGTRFRAGLVSNSVCAPSRAGLLSGRAGALASSLIFPTNLQASPDPGSAPCRPTE